MLFRLEEVRKQYGARTVLSLDALDIVEGEVLALIGPSGAGKSTLLRLLALLEAPTSGHISFDAKPVAQLPIDITRSIVMVFQRPLLLDRSVRQNIAYGLHLRNRHDPHLVGAAIARLGLRDVADAPARTLSGGEMQRVALARTLVIEPRVLLLDEPTANLDPANVAIIEDVVRDLHRRGTTIIVATHNLHQARRIAGRSALLLDGRLVETGPTAEMFASPSDPHTRAFISGEMIY